MSKQQFAEFLDASLQDLRQQLLDAFPDAFPSEAAGEEDESPESSPTEVHVPVQAVQAAEEDEAAAWKKIEALHPPRERLVSHNTEQSRHTELSVGRESSLTASETGDETAIFHGSGHLKSGLIGVSTQEALAIRHRLRVRLGALSSKTLVSGKALQEAVSSLGLTRYTEADMNDLVNMLADFINLGFEDDCGGDDSPAAGNAADDLDLFIFHHRDSRVYGRPTWQWPLKDEAGPPMSLRKSVTGQFTGHVHTLNFAETQAKSSYNVVPAQALIDIFLSHEADIHKRIFGPRLMNQFRAMREILLAGDTNRLVAELTFVRINDLAAPPEPVHPLLYIEPLVAILIVGNGVMIGLQTDPAYTDWPGWVYVEIVFAGFLLLEIALRMHFLRCGNYWCGPERWWNRFDLFLAGTGIFDITIQLVRDEKSDFAGTSLLRFCRLIRLVRIVKVFRIRFMKDLRLMVKGLVAGIRTLTLAFLLLFAVLYVISGFATMTLGSDPRTQELGLGAYFNNIPAAMFTAFRCFNGECVNDLGQPINSLLADEFGLPFIMCYVGSYMLVTMGIFNVILAVYVDITMKAAKENDAVTAEQHSRESIRVARTTRELLEKFASAYHAFGDLEDAGKDKPEKLPSSMLFKEDGFQDRIAITKELFLLVIQDRGVQKLMDELDLPPDRANLFEIIDADGSGTLQITELLQGLLKIRGEINKSDTVASLLATKAVQEMLSEMKQESLDNFLTLQREFQQQFTDLGQRMTKVVAKAMARSQAKRGEELSRLRAPRKPADLGGDIEMPS